MNIAFYTHTKRDNSTLQPTGTGTQYSVELKFPSGVMTPVITTANSAILAYNYCYIGTYNRYYFIKDWEYKDGLWHVYLLEDCLASWKSDIGSASLYVLRSSAESDPYVVDTIYPATKEITKKFTTINMGWTPANGTYVVGIVNASGQTSPVGGGVVYYAMTAQGFKSIVSSLLTVIETDIGSLITDGAQCIAKALANPISWIRSCIYIPFSWGTQIAVGTSEPIKFGAWNSGATATPMLNKMISDAPTFNINLSDHPQLSRGKYLNGNPYRRAVLEAGPFGSIPLDPDLVIESDTIKGMVTCDTITGAGVLNLRMSSGLTTFYEHNYYGQLGVPIELAQATQNIMSAISGVGGALAGAGMGIAGVATGNPMLALSGASGAVSGIGNALEGLQPMPSSTGQNGSFAALGLGTGLSESFVKIADEDNTRLGRPLCKIRQLSSISGFIQCAEGDIPAPATLNELNTIKGYLEGGFYYE